MARWVRRAVVGVLGAVLIVDGASGRFEVVPFVVGLLMVGLVPVDAVVDAITRPAADDRTLDRLGEVMREKDPKPDD